jgi:type IV pilus assembly protein PilO
VEKYILQLGELTWSKVVASGLVALGLYWFLYYDDGSNIEATIQGLQVQLVEAEKNLAATKQAMADTVKFEKEVSNNEKQFDKVKDYMPADMNANELTRLVSQWAGEAGAKVNSTKPKLEIEKKEFYETIRLDFTVAGRFEQLVTFLASLSAVPKLLTFDEIQVTTVSGLAKADEAPTIEMKGTLVGYRYLQDVTVDAATGGVSGSP